MIRAMVAAGSWIRAAVAAGGGRDRGDADAQPPARGASPVTSVGAAVSVVRDRRADLTVRTRRYSGYVDLTVRRARF